MVSRALKKSLGSSALAQHELDGFIARIRSDEEGYAWSVTPVDSRAGAASLGRSEHVEVACAIAALRLLDAIEHAATS